jgi:hypothetical protein
MTHKIHTIRGRTVKLAFGIDDLDLVDFSIEQISSLSHLFMHCY